MQFPTLCIVVTRACNGGTCTYCHVLKDHSVFTFGEEEKETLRSLIPQLTDVKLFGGEPLLFADTCKEIIRFLREDLSFSGDIHLNTNLLSPLEDILPFLDEHKVIIHFSLDGHVKTVSNNRKLSQENLQKTFQQFQLILSSYPHSRLVNNVVFAPDSIQNAYQDVLFLMNNGVQRLNLLPAMYVLWEEKHLLDLEQALCKIITATNNYPTCTLENLSINSRTCL